METISVEDGGTRTGAGSRFWKDQWHAHFPKTGEGKFIYQHHWSGLSENEIALPESQLLETSKSVHGDLRFETDHGVWGVSVFLGTTTDNRFSYGDAFLNADASQKFQVAFKSLHDKQWLDSAYVTQHETEFAKDGTRFFNVDEGSYSIGVWKQDLYEVFLHGQYLKGRYLIHGIPFGIRKRTFVIARPQNQVALALQRDRKDVEAEQVEKGGSCIVWRVPGENPVKIGLTKEDAMEKAFTENSRGLNETETMVHLAERGDRYSKHGADYYEYFGREEHTCQKCVFYQPGGVDEDGSCRVVKGPIGAEATCSFFISQREQQPRSVESFKNSLGQGKVIFAKAGEENEPFGFVLSPILEPEVVDLQGDIVSIEEIEKAAHGYMEDSQQGGFMHTEPLDQTDVVLVESYLARSDTEIAGVSVRKGTWIGGWRVYNKTLRKMIREGHITGVSIGGASEMEIEDE